MQRPPHHLASISLLLALAACATGPAQELAVADMLPVNAADSLLATPDYTLFFDLDSAMLTADAAAILDQVAKNPARPRWTRIILAGHADRSGSKRYNRGLSAERIEAVRRYLLAAGIPTALITSAAFGETRGLVGTPDGAVEPQNRRVEIYLREN